MPSAAPDPALTAPALPGPALADRFRRDLAAIAPDLAGDPARRLGIALSGGPDSCALLLLAAAAWPGRIAAMTVDHGLRSEAAQEADEAAALCRSYAVPHDTARVRVEGGGAGGVQAAARAARYAALDAWAMREGLAAILTAHHADDQAETVLMRLARGSGLAGLAGVRAARPLARPGAPGPRLLRPLLGWRKDELEAIVAAAGIVPARDPSNHDDHYDRTHARRLLARTPWLDAGRIAQAARNLADAEAALAWTVDGLAPQAISETPGGVTLSGGGLPREIARRLLVRLFADRFAAHPAGPAVERAMTALGRGETVTLADILCRPEGTLWHFRPAPPRRLPGRSG